MKIHCTKADLHKGMQVIQSALSPRTTLPILLNFLIETENQKLKMVSTDLQIGLKHYIPAEVESDGSITIPAKKFSDIIQSLQDNQDIYLTVDIGGRVFLKSGHSKFSMSGTAKSEYPMIPSFNPEKAFKIPADTLLSMLKKTVFATSSDETKHFFNGVLWVGSQDVLSMVATDGRRLAKIQRKCLLDNKEFRAIVPTKVLGELSRLLSSQEGSIDGQEVSIVINENQIGFQFGVTTLISRLIEGNYPNFDQVIPKKKDVHVLVGTDELLGITKRAALCASDRGGSVRYVFKNGVLQVLSSSQNLEFNDEIALDYSGDEFSIAVNPQYIMDGLKNINSEKISLGMTTPTLPVLMETTSDPEYQYVFMPLKV